MDVLTLIMFSIIALLVFLLLFVVNLGARESQKIDQKYKSVSGRFDVQRNIVVKYNTESEELCAMAISTLNMLNSLSPSDASRVMKTVMQRYDGSSGIMAHHTNRIFKSLSFVYENGSTDNDSENRCFYVVTPTADTLESILDGLRSEADSVIANKEAKSLN